MIEIKIDKIKLVPISKIKTNPKNRNAHPKEQIDQLVKLIEYQGFRQALTVSNRTGLLVAGHGRLMAARALKMKELPVSYQDFTDEAQEYAYGVSDNAIQQQSLLDFAAINTDLPDFGPDFDVDWLGIKDFTVDVVEKLPDGDPDEVPEPPKEPKSKLGDLWTLGAHRLLCGDSTDILAVERLMDGQKADMVFTDPPYGMDLDTDYSKMPSTKKEGNKQYSRVIGDGEDFSAEIIQTMLGFFSYCHEVFIFGADYFSELIPDKNKGSWVVWDKRVTENFDAMIGSAFELCWSKAKHKREIARFNNTLFSGESEARNKVHPTQKPTKMIEWFFEKWGNPKDQVVDLFGGSGSTLIACEKTNRKCFMVELDPKYIDVILARFAKYAGKDPIRDDGVKWSEIANGTA